MAMCGVIRPVDTHSQISAAMTLGRLSLRASTRPKPLATSHAASSAITTSQGLAAPRNRRNPCTPTLLAPNPDAVASTMDHGPLLGVATCHFLPERIPDFLVHAPEAIIEADLIDVARPSKVDRELAFHHAGVCGHHHHPIGERDGLLQIVGDEQHGLAVLLPQ